MPSANGRNLDRQPRQRQPMSEEARQRARQAARIIPGVAQAQDASAAARRIRQSQTNPVNRELTPEERARAERRRAAGRARG